MYLLPRLVLFLDMARCASAGEVKVTQASPVARPSRWPRMMPLLPLICSPRKKPVQGEAHTCE